MKKPNPSYIQVTKDFPPVLDKFATLLYEKQLKNRRQLKKRLSTW